MPAPARIVAVPSAAPAAVAPPADWIETPTAARIVAALAFAQATSDVAVIYGAGGVGKTCTARHYAADMANAWHAIMTPATAGVVPALEEVCAALGIPPSNGAAPLHRSIVKRVAGTGGLLIVDEAQHLAPAALDQLRSIHDAAGIGVALLGSRDVYARLVGGDTAATLDRLRSRVGRRLHLTATTADDTAAVAAARGIGTADARKTLAEIGAKAGGLRGVAKVLRLASLHAAGRALTDADLRAAWRELGGA
ncbi:MAG: AAA family ATPase [Rhodanobacteraceae bacterium]|jgi:hypothetical protein|nr:AAA family ATPase [Rhodanobacteraceae bacterium]